MRLGPAGAKGLGFYTARDGSGQDVIAFGSADMISPFTSRKRFNAKLASDKLYVYSADGGPSLDTVSHRELLGQVSADVTSVEVVLQDGSTRELPLVDQSFVYSSDQNGALPLQVIAYGNGGARLASKDLPPPSAPGQQ